ncbi:DUF300-domain-containing protein [Peniophora sp. CONT]|nr:DUF300-domain-containing protein [Peniophora sp. CONT]
MASIYEVDIEPMAGGGSGNHLGPVLLILAGSATAIATIVSAWSIFLHLKNYRKPQLQRMVIRIMVMVPIYAISSLISLFSLEAAFVIDALRDIYEAFVIYCFFNLLLNYLGGERSLLILVHGRAPKYPPKPMNIFQPELDVSDPYTFLFLKRGIMQYVYVKPCLALASLILKYVGKYNEGDLRANSGYLYVSIVYNASICLSLYCLAMFWLSISEDLKPFRPMPKFLCVKGILFFSFWQSIFISILVAAGFIAKLGPYTDSEHISLGLTDMLICLEMPFFAIAHMYAFSEQDYVDKDITFVGRMPIRYAIKDAFGHKDVMDDLRNTVRGEGMDYREFEPTEGFIHQGLGRERRIKAGLRYSKGGRGKYWLPHPATDSRPGRTERAMDRALGVDEYDSVHAPLLSGEAQDVLHDETDTLPSTVGYEIPFGDPSEDDEELFEQSKQYLFGDYLYPCIDVSSETARKTMWDAEEAILRDERSAWDSDFKGRRRTSRAQQPGGYGAVATSSRAAPQASGSGSGSSGRGSPQVKERVIDMEAERMQSGDPNDVKLRWNKVAKLTPPGSRPGSAAPSPKRDHPPRLPASRTHSYGSSPRSSPSQAPPRALARSPMNGSPRSDAVDLVVEDEQLAEDEHLQERRRGEPAVRGSGLRKVYRRHYLPHEQPEQVEEVGEENVHAAGASRSDLQEIAHQMAQSEDEIGQGTPDLSGNGVGILRTDAPVARVQTPPPHAVTSPTFSPPPVDDDNPWA